MNPFYITYELYSARRFTNNLFLLLNGRKDPFQVLCEKQLDDILKQIIFNLT